MDCCRVRDERFDVGKIYAQRDWPCSFSSAFSSKLNEPFPVQIAEADLAEFFTQLIETERLGPRAVRPISLRSSR